MRAPRDAYSVRKAVDTCCWCECVIIRTDNFPREFAVSVFLIGLTKLAKKHNIKIYQIFMAEYHGATPCDAEQRYLKQMRATLGTERMSFRDNLTSLINHLNSDIGQRTASDTTFTAARRAFLIPAMEISKSIWMAANATQSFKAYWTTDTVAKLGRRRILCLADCCDHKSAERQLSQHGEVRRS